MRRSIVPVVFAAAVALAGCDKIPGFGRSNTASRPDVRVPNLNQVAQPVQPQQPVQPVQPQQPVQPVQPQQPAQPQQPQQAAGMASTMVPGGVNLNGLPAMNLRTSGTAPTFEWDAVPGAATYSLSVSGNPAGTVPWVWVGTATRVDYGALVGEGDTERPPIPTNAPPPRALFTLQPGQQYTWQVTAYDANGQIVAISHHHQFTR